MLPIVAIVGRPNVGKSSLLNRIAGRMISIVDPTPGVTRDRVGVICHHNDRYFELVDTGGVGIVDADNLGDDVQFQIELAIEQASLVLFLADTRQGVMPLDQRVATMLRPVAKKVILVANKADTAAQDNLAGELYRLGFGEPLMVSALHGRNMPELLDRITDRLAKLNLGGEEFAGEAAEPEMKIAIVGKRNAGKSTFINAIAGSPRVITSQVPGTTRDAIDVRFVREGRTFVAIDTAGVRRRQSVKGDIDFYSVARAERSIRRCDVALLMIDATEPVSIVDKQLGRYIIDQFKPVILVINKFDLVKDRATSGQYAEYLAQVLPGLDFAPVVVTTATEQRNVYSVLDLAANLFKQANSRVSTAALNEAVELITGERGPGGAGGRGPNAGPVKVFYATQVAIQPPTVVLFVNKLLRVNPSFEKFVINRLRDRLPFKEVPIRLLVRERARRALPGQEAPERPTAQNLRTSGPSRRPSNRPSKRPGRGRGKHH